MTELAESSETPQILRNFGQAHGCQFRMKTVADKKKFDRKDSTAYQLLKVKDEHKEGKKQGKTAQSDGDQNGSEEDDAPFRILPTASYNLGYLRSKKIIARLCKEFPEGNFRDLDFTFYYRE